MNINKFIILSSTIALASCSTVKMIKQKVEFAAHNYPNMFIPVRVDVAKSSVKTAIGQNNSIANITQLKNLNELEKGRLLQLNGDFKGSIVSYANAIKTVPQSEEESIKKAKSIVLDRKSYNYYDIKQHIIFQIMQFQTYILIKL